MKGIRFLIVLAIVFTHKAKGHIVTGVKSVSILFTTRRWLQSPKTKYALQDVTADLASDITAFCGSSGSGKSTLAKLIHGQFSADDYEGSIILDSSVSMIPTVYVDPLFYLTYDSTKTVGHYFKPDIMTSEKSVFFLNLRATFNIPEEKVINNLLESQRKFFEILLSFSRMKGAKTDSQGLLILDEYLDKDMSSVRLIFFKKLRELFENKSISFQVIIISHSKAVCNYCDSVIALKNGFVYSYGNPDKIMKNLPPDFVVLD